MPIIHFNIALSYPGFLLRNSTFKLLRHSIVWLKGSMKHTLKVLEGLFFPE